MRFTKLILAIVVLFASQSGPFLNRDPELRPGTQALFSGPIPAYRQNSYLFYMEQRLKKDLAALFQKAQEITEELQFSRSANYKQVSHTANKIRKLASRIKSGLTLDNRHAEEKNLAQRALQPSNSESLQSKVDELGQLVYKIRQSSARRSKHVIDAKLQHELYAQLDTLETLALQVKMSAEELTRSFGRADGPSSAAVNAEH